jgi:hypothetical protein
MSNNPASFVFIEVLIYFLYSKYRFYS